MENSRHSHLHRNRRISGSGVHGSKGSNTVGAGQERHRIPRYGYPIHIVFLSQPCVDIKGWTRTHSYFVVMGGFEGWGRSLGPFRQRCGRGTETALESYPEMLKRDTPVLEAELAQNPATPPRQEENQASDFRILVTESEILDKSKGDPLGKLFTVLQTTWFIIQYLERWITHRPRTQLEVMTLAYAALNILIYALWWGKPLNIKEPIDVGGRASAVVIRRTEELRGLGPVLAAAFKMPFTDERGIAVRDDSVFFSIIFPVVGIIFGGVHCFAWWFPFPTSQERLLWRVCAVYCTATPCLVTVVCFIGFAPYSRFPEWINAVLKALLRWYRQLTGWTGRERGTLGAILPFVPYMACRIILVVLTFTSLRAPPPGIYEATLWPTFLPHFG